MPDEPAPRRPAIRRHRTHPISPCASRFSAPCFRSAPPAICRNRTPRLCPAARSRWRRPDLPRRALPGGDVGPRNPGAERETAPGRRPGRRGSRAHRTVVRVLGATPRAGDPHHRVDLSGIASSDARTQLPDGAAWVPVDALDPVTGPLVHDHGKIVDAARQRLAAKLSYEYRVRTGAQTVRDVRAIRNILRCTRLQR